MNSPSYAARVGRGIVVGLVCGLILCLWASVVTVLGEGRTVLEEAGLPLVALFGIYLLGGALVGALIGASYRLARHKLGAPMVALLIILPILVIMRLFAAGLEPWTWNDSELFLGALLITTPIVARGLYVAHRE